MDDMKLQERWQYYISSYLRTEPTEGVDREKLSKIVLNRNIPSNETDSDDGNVPKAVSFDENLVVNICLRTSKMVWDAGSSESFLSNAGPATKKDWGERENTKDIASAQRAHKLREKFVMNNSWMKDLSQEEVEKRKAAHKRWVEEGVVNGEGTEGGKDVEMSG